MSHEMADHIRDIQRFAVIYRSYANAAVQKDDKVMEIHAKDLLALQLRLGTELIPNEQLLKRAKDHEERHHSSKCHRGCRNHRI